MNKLEAMINDKFEQLETSQTCRMFIEAGRADTTFAIGKFYEGGCTCAAIYDSNEKLIISARYESMPGWACSIKNRNPYLATK